MSDYPLQGLRVIELAAGIAAAYTGKMLSDAGADVVLVEPPGGSPLRRWKASVALDGGEPLAGGETGVLFQILHGNKIGTAADLTTPAGREALQTLARDADLLIDEGRLREAGIDGRALLADCPDLSIISISDWGESGPYAGRTANEYTLQAEVGATAYRGYKDRPPFAAGGRIGDYVCGSFAAVAAMAAVRMAPGRYVEVSRFESMLLSFQPYQYVHGQLEPGVLVPASVDVPSIEPAKDGWVGFCTVTDKQWKDFAEMIGRPELGEDPDLVTGFHRFQHLERVQPAIHAWTRERSVAEIIAEAGRRRIPVAPVGNGATVLEMAQFKERDVFWENPAGFRQPRPPYRLGSGDVRRPGRAPAMEPGQAPAWPDRPADPTARSEGLPMAGLRVLDFSAFWAGPIGSACFALFGADVIKVESIQRPDGMRFSAGFFPKDKPLWECSPITHGANAGKRGITLDLTDERGLKLAKRLVAECDIVIENFSPRVMEKFGLGWETVHALNPEAIMVRMPAFGLEGPWRERTGFAMTMEQVSGLAWRTGYPDRSPVVPRGCVDPLGGMNAVFATLAALRLRERGAGGQQVEVALAEAGLNIVVEQVAEYTAYGNLLERHANRGPEAAPQGVFTCRDRAMVAVSVETDSQWRALVKVIDSDALRDPALASESGRRAREDELETALGGWCAERDADTVVEILVAAGVPAAPLRNVRELQNHPQLRERGFFTRLEHAVVGELDYPNFPFRIDGEYLPIGNPAPLLGEHNAEVLCGLLGLVDGELEVLEKAGVIGNKPAFG